MKIIKIAQEILVNMSQKRVPLFGGVKNKINSDLNNIGDHFSQIPLGTIQTILKKYNIHLLQEDGTAWSGFLVGGKDCGEDGAEEQRATFDMAIKDGENKYSLLKCWLHMTWCKLSSGRYEVIKYIS